ncbi:hypothetical protein [Sporosarcina sp. FSL K6-1508]|uniref:hypothetical protein n=1 Tax=Sporosarcina sp. FSL K6-1508 TaxID=2921553 RepID=UPI0030F62403
MIPNNYATIKYSGRVAGGNEVKYVAIEDDVQLNKLSLVHQIASDVWNKIELN